MRARVSSALRTIGKGKAAPRYSRAGIAAAGKCAMTRSRVKQTGRRESGTFTLIPHAVHFEQAGKKCAHENLFPTMHGMGAKTGYNLH
jgi:hypothetical protein